MLLRKQAANCQQLKNITNAISVPLHPPLGLFPSIPCCIVNNLRKKKLVWLKNEYVEEQFKIKSKDYGQTYLLKTKEWRVFLHVKKNSIIHRNTKFFTFVFF